MLAENVLSMCLKEATTNIVRHSKANLCEIKISETNEETSIMIKDNGIGFDQQTISYSTHGIRGMIERLEFMNGNLSIHSNNGTRSEEHTSELQSRGHLVCRLLLQKKNKHGIK